MAVIQRWLFNGGANVGHYITSDLSTGYSVHPLWEGREGGKEREGGRREEREGRKVEEREFGTGKGHQYSHVGRKRKVGSSILCNLVQIPLVW